MERKETTPHRAARRKYEEKHKDERKKANKVWGTSIGREVAEEIDEYVIKHRLTKVDLIYAGFIALQNQYGPNKTQ